MTCKNIWIAEIDKENSKFYLSETDFDDIYGYIVEDLCLWYNIYNREVEIGQYSPLGEDFSFTVDIENFIDNVHDYYMDFDPDEHAEMWIEAKTNGRKDIPSIRQLIKDADDINDMLLDLNDALLTLKYEVK